jgi:hypothetical protein
MKTHLGSDTGTDKDIVGSSNKCWTVETVPLAAARQRQQKKKKRYDNRNRSRTGTDDNTSQFLDNKAFYGVESPDCKWPPYLCWPL